jgi:hypothetical protein
MPDYTDIDFFRSLLPSGTSLDDETSPTVTQVESMMLSTGQSLNAAYAQGGGTVPVTDTNVKGRFKLHQTKHLVWLFLAARGIESKDKYWENWGEEFWADFLALLSTPEGAASVEPESGEPWSGTMDLTQDDMNPAFERGMQH